jgi:hypothetical protein
MKKKDPKEKIIDLLQGNLTPEEAREVISGLEEAGIDASELESLRRISHLIDSVNPGEPSSDMDRRFYEMLANEKNEAMAAEKGLIGKRWFQASSFNVGIRIAAGIALFLLGWFTASWSGQKFNTDREMADVSNKLTDLKQTLVLTMMQQNSSLERIKAVNMLNEFDSADERIIESLLGALNHDENDNVRLLSLEALIRYSDNPAVREGLVASIVNQSSPMIQLRLAEVMVALNERKAAHEFQKVLMNSGLNYSVRNKINEAVTVLL